MKARDLLTCFTKVFISIIAYNLQFTKILTRSQSYVIFSSKYNNSYY